MIVLICIMSQNFRSALRRFSLNRNSQRESCTAAHLSRLKFFRTTFCSIQNYYHLSCVGFSFYHYYFAKPQSLLQIKVLLYSFLLRMAKRRQEFKGLYWNKDRDENQFQVQFVVVMFLITIYVHSPSRQFNNICVPIYFYINNKDTNNRITR